MYPSLKYTFSYILKCIKDNFINEKITEYNNKKNVHKIIKYIVKYLTGSFFIQLSVNIVTLPGEYFIIIQSFRLMEYFLIWQ